MQLNVFDKERLSILLLLANLLFDSNYYLFKKLRI